MGLFDNWFDFDRDGKTSFGEEAFGLGLIGMIMEEAGREEREADAMFDESKEDDDM